VRIHYLGHAAFLFEAQEAGVGTRVIVDPYQADAYGGRMGYAPIHETADVALFSHKHPDHYGPASVAGPHATLDSPGVYDTAGLHIVGIESFHDDSRGSERGENVIWRFDMDGLKVAHLGDLGHQLSDSQVGGIGPVDVVCVPIGGHFTIDAAGAHRVIARLGPRVVIPMHYLIPGKFQSQLTDERRFLEMGPEPVVHAGGTDVALMRPDLPDEETIYVLKPSR
jgi:L-ascorbate metabolism protein UlaG (beta-lactamase superfamily)